MNPTAPNPTTPKGPPFLPAVLVIAGAQLMVVLDISIVTIALPSIRGDLGFAQGDLQWVLNAYTLTFGGLLLLGGRASDILGRRSMFVTGVCVFTLVSLVGGFAPGPGWLIAARAVQGAAGAVIAPTALALVSTTFAQGRQRNAAFGVYGAVSGSGAVIGLLLGGALTDSLSWRWVLWVNVPIGIAIAVGARLLLRHTPGHPGRFDIPGAITATGGLTLLVYGLVRAPQHGWADVWTVTSIATAVALLLLFVGLEARGSQPLMPLRIFADRDRAGAYAVAVLVGASLISTLFFLAQFVQEVMGYSPLRNGVAFLPNALCVLAFSGVAARLVTRTGSLPLMALGTLSMGCGLWWLSGIDVTTEYASGLLPGLLLFGSGLGLLFVPMAMTAVAAVADEDSGLAAGLLNTSQQVGGSVGLASLSTVAADTTKDELPPGRPAPGQVAHAVTEGWSAALSVSVGFVALALVVTLLMVRAKPQTFRAPGGERPREEAGTGG
ncbi:MFS transporter [Streptomyces sp. NPDC050658]|uniref:MFS transporter n=1 Tax=unclassified Streptomyces TaxID=2593676 RepID=UPI00343680A0